MLEPFLGAKVRAGRAHELIDSLKDAGKAYWDGHPYVQLREPNPDGLTDTFKFRITRQPPGVFDLLVVEAVEHMRAALDYIGYDAAVLGGAVEPKSSYFPIADSAAKLESDVIGRGRCKDLPPDILTAFRSFEPYYGGKASAVWVLNKLRNSGTHRFLTSVGLTSSPTDITPDQLPPEAIVLPQVWDSSKNEINYFSVPSGMRAQYGFEVAFYIAFDEVEPVAGLPVVPHLFAMLEKVREIVEETEMVARRAGLIL